MPLILPDCLKEFVSCLLPPHTFRLNYTINKLNGADTGIKRERRNVVSQRMYEDGHVVAKIHLLSYVNLFVVVRNYQTDQYDIGETCTSSGHPIDIFHHFPTHLIYKYKTVFKGG